ncbi:MAG: hypothetical protein AAGD38_23935 [Acidobacteriota bacterium]
MKQRSPRFPSIPPLAVAVLFTAVLVTGPLHAATDDSTVRDASLEGTWQGNGPGGPCTITIKGDTLHFKARDDFWYETTFILPSDTYPQQIHTTIVKDSTGKDKDIGKVVVSVYKIENGQLTLAVINSFDGPPTEPITTESNWALIELDWTKDKYNLTRIEDFAQ